MRIITLLFSVSLLLGACRKVKFVDGENYLPRATEKGRGIFACYVNESTYTARRQERINYNAETGYLFLHNANSKFEFRLFVYEGVFEEGNYAFENTNEEWITTDYESYYGIKEGGVNELNISKLDFQANIIAGTFNIDLVNEAGYEKLIREGRFDLKMNFIK